MKTTVEKKIIFLLASLIALSSFAQTSTELDYPEKSGVVINKYDKKMIEDLAVLCKTWGFVKFYHPEVVIMGKYDMDSELFGVMPKVLSAKSKNDRNNILDKWVSQFGDVKTWDTIPVYSPDKVKEYPDLDWIGESANLGKVSKQLLKIKDARRESDTSHYVVFPYGPSAFMWKENQYAELPSLDVGYRLAGLFRLWNSVQYYFAYKYLMDDKWDDVLREFIPQFIDADGELGYKLAVLKMITKLEDSHARIMHPLDGSNPRVTHPDIDNWEGKYMLPFEITFIEGKAVITESYPVQAGTKKNYSFRIGDVILSVNEESVENIIKRKLEYTPAADYVGKLKKIATSVLRSNTDKIKIKYERDGEIKSGEYDALPLSKVEVLNRTRKNLPAYTKMDNGVVYIYLGSTRGETLPEQFDADTKGVIIDLRSFPNSIKNYWGYFPLFPDTTLYAYLTVPSIAYPGLYTYTEGSRAGRENPNYFKGKKVLLIDEYSLSQAEFLAMQYGSTPNTTLIGSKTTGADGNVSVVDLPGVSVSYTGMGAYYPDRRETQRVGILPDIEIKPTIKGIREGRDEVLERAIEFLLQD